MKCDKCNALIESRDERDYRLSEIERQIAKLRHMEKLKAAMGGDRKGFRLW